METRLEDSVAYVRRKAREADFIPGENLALVGYTYDGRALYDRRLFNAPDISESTGRAILLTSWVVQNHEDLIAKLASAGFGDVPSLSVDDADISAACMGVTVSGGLVYRPYDIVTILEGAGYDGQDALRRLSALCAEDTNPGNPMIAEFAYSVQDIYGEKMLISDRPLYATEDEFPKELHLVKFDDCGYLIGATNTGRPVYDAQGAVVRHCLEHGVGVVEAKRELSERFWALYVLPYGVSVPLKGSPGVRIPCFGRTLDGIPVADADTVRGMSLSENTDLGIILVNGPADPGLRGFPARP